MKTCKWCDPDPITDYCDCKERMECPKAGELGHTQCGVHKCGCPVFEGDCAGKCKEED